MTFVKFEYLKLPIVGQPQNNMGLAPFSYLNPLSFQFSPSGSSLDYGIASAVNILISNVFTG